MKAGESCDIAAMSRPSAGVAYALGAYLTWGLFPAYWKQLAGVPSLHVVSHRVIWSFAVVAILLSQSRRWPEFRLALADRRTFWPMLLSTALISCNWLLFIWAVNSGHVTQGSLGYYINPLLNVLLARVFLGERLSRVRLAAIAVAGAGVLNLTIALGEFPWVALTLASTFALYGLVKKVAPVEPLTGLAVETFLAMPVAIGWLAWSAHASSLPVFAGTTRETLFLLGAGLATALPLLWFAVGAKRLPYATMGIIQYVAPTCQLGLAVLVYGEPFTRQHAITFVLIWAAVILYAADGFRSAARASRPQAAVDGVPATRS